MLQQQRSSNRRLRPLPVDICVVAIIPPGNHPGGVARRSVGWGSLHVQQLQPHGCQQRDASGSKYQGRTAPQHARGVRGNPRARDALAATGRSSVRQPGCPGRRASAVSCWAAQVLRVPAGVWEAGQPAAPPWARATWCSSGTSGTWTSS